MPTITTSLILQILFGLFAAFAAGFGAVAAWRSHNFSRTVKGREEGEIDALAFLEAQGHVPRPKRKRTSQCYVLLESGSIRTVKGGYICGWVMRSAETLYANDAGVERMYAEAAVMLAMEKPEDTILQTRLANHTDRGRAIAEHREASGGPGEVYEPARIIHEAQLTYYEACAGMNAYKDFNSSVWLFVPVRGKGDNNHNGLFSKIKRSLEASQRRGVSAGLKVLFESEDGVIRRLKADEIAAQSKADKLFRQLEDAAPTGVKLVRLSRDETWEALYYGHNESATSAPPTPPPHADLRQFLCRDDITAHRDDWYVRHGRTPVSMISLFVPPQDGVPTEIMRSIVMDARLSRRFTAITEFTYMEKEKEKKKLRRRADVLEKVSIDRKGRTKMDKDTQRAFAENAAVDSELSGSASTLTGMDFRVLVYGAAAMTKEALKESVKQLELDCEAVINVLRKRFPGCDAGLEAPAALRQLYHRSIVGEMLSGRRRKSYRTIKETTDKLSPFIALERPWRGMRNPHSLVDTTAGGKIGLNFYDNDHTQSALGIIIAEPGGGKSVAGIKFAADIIGSMQGANGAGVGFGNSFTPFVETIGGRVLSFDPADPMPINVWDYAGLEGRVMPDDTQKNFVTEDALTLANAPRGEGTEAALYKAVVKKAVEEVYQDEIPNNRPNWPRHEPQHIHLVRKLRQYPFEGQQKIIAENVASVLEGFVGHPWIDAPTHPAYREESVFDLYQLDSLKKFDKDIGQSLAYRAAVRVSNRIGRLNEDGELVPVILLFDECQNIAESYPSIMRVIRFNAAREGRKNRTFTLLMSQSWKDFSQIADITATAGVKIVGKQASDDADEFVRAAKWPASARDAIYAINNIKGLQSQFVISFGAGSSQQIEMIQLELSPVELWTFSTLPVEQNARTRVLKRVPEWTMAEAIIYLTSKYPRGLAPLGLQEPDLRELPAPRQVETQAVAVVTQPQAAALLDDKTIEAYRQLGEARPTELPTSLKEFTVTAPGAGGESTALALTGQAAGAPEEIVGEYAGETEDVKREAVAAALSTLADFVGDHVGEPTQRGRSRAQQLGVDIEGAIVVDAEEEDATTRVN